MNNKYAIEVLKEQVKERKKYVDNWETKDTQLIRANISKLMGVPEKKPINHKHNKEQSNGNI